MNRITLRALTVAVAVLGTVLGSFVFVGATPNAGTAVGSSPTPTMTVVVSKDGDGQGEVTARDPAGYSGYGDSLYCPDRCASDGGNFYYYTWYGGGYGYPVRLQAKPSAGSNFVWWRENTINGDCDYWYGQYCDEYTDYNQSVDAVFTKMRRVTTDTTAGTGFLEWTGCSIFGRGRGGVRPAGCGSNYLWEDLPNTWHTRQYFPRGQVVTFHAVGWNKGGVGFIRWTGGPCATGGARIVRNPYCTFRVNGNVSLKAAFQTYYFIP